MLPFQRWPKLYNLEVLEEILYHAGRLLQGGSSARSRGNEREMPRETLEKIANQLGSLDGDQLQVGPGGGVGAKQNAGRHSYSQRQ